MALGRLLVVVLGINGLHLSVVLGVDACLSVSGLMKSRFPRYLSTFSLVLLVAVAAVAFVGEPARAQVFPGSVVQVGPWELGAYANRQNSTFEQCAMQRVQNDGFVLTIANAPNGRRLISGGAPQWGLNLSDTYTTSFTIGASAFTFAGSARTTNTMSWKVSPEFFTELKSGHQLSVTAHQRYFVVSLDGIETAMARLVSCVKEYAGRTLPPSPVVTARPPTTAPLSALVILETPKPVYPAHSRYAGEQGTVVIDTQVGTDGLVSIVVLRSSSGYPVLDQSALEAVKTMRFEPYTVSGKAQTVWVRVPIRFVLSSEGKPLQDGLVR